MTSRNVNIDIKANTSQYTRAVNSAERATAGLGNSVINVKSLAIGAGAAGAVAIAAIGTAAIKVGIEAAQSFAKFEKSLAQIEGLVGVSSEALAGMTGELKEIAVATATGPQELAEALFFITSAGLEGAQAMDALEVSAKASAAGLGDTATIADVVTSAMNAYGDSMSGAGEATDVLVATVREGKAEAPALASALGQVIPIASAMGISFDQVGAAIAAMTRVGLDANEAGTALRGIMTSLLKPTTEAEAALERMGMSAQGVRDQIREEGLLAALSSLSEAFDGNADATTAVFGNVRALSGVMSLLGDNADATKDIFDSLANSTGALDTAFGVSSETGAFAFEQAKVRIETALLEVGERILPMLADAIDQIAPHIPDLVEGLGEVAIAFVDLATQMAPAVTDFLGNLDTWFLATEATVLKVQALWSDAMVTDLFAGPGVSDLDQQRIWVNTQIKVNNALRDGYAPTAVLATALKEMASQGTITTEQIDALAVRVGIGGDEWATYSLELLKSAPAAGWTADQVAALAESVWTAGAANRETALDVAEAADAFDREAIAASHADTAVQTATVTVQHAKTPYMELAEAIQATIDAQESLAGLFLEMVSPTFKAIKAVERMEAAQAKLEEVQKTRKVTAEELAAAEIGVVEATLLAQAALDGVTSTNLEASVQAVQTILGVTREEAFALLETLGLLDGMSIQMYADLTVRPGPGIPAPEYIPPRFGGPRAHGGPVRAGQQYLVGEEGPELFSPSNNGIIIPNNVLNQQTSSSSVVVDLSGSVFGGTTDVTAGVQAGLIAAGVSEEIEWVGSTTIR